MQKLKKGIHVLILLFICAMGVFIVSMTLYPEKTSEFIGYRWYSVLTNSMEPTIPTGSLVFTKRIDESVHIPPNTIITFKANRLGQNVLVTHYFRKTQEKDGVLYYRTQPEGEHKNYDLYETKRSDIIGTYIFHIPYVGKVIMFLQSKFGFLMYAELIVIWLINKLIKTRWEEKEEMMAKDEIPSQEAEQVLYDPRNEIAEENLDEMEKIEDKLVYIRDIQVSQYRSLCEVKAALHNDQEHALRDVFAEIAIYDEQHKMQKRYVIRIARNQAIPPHSVHYFNFRFQCKEKLTSCKIDILKE